MKAPMNQAKLLCYLALGIGVLSLMVLASSLKFSSRHPRLVTTPAAGKAKGISPVPPQPLSKDLTEPKIAPPPARSPRRRFLIKVSDQLALENRLNQTIPPFDDEDEQGNRLDWFYQQRAYPSKSVPTGARLQAMAQLSTEEDRLRQASAAAGEPSPFDGQSAWTPLGPQPISNGQTFGTPSVAVAGRVTAIALDPRYDGTSNQTVYLGAAQGGVWRSTDNGANWTPLTDNQPSLVIGAIAIDPTNPNIIYAGTGEANSSCDTYYGAGLLKSTDGGTTWTQITGPISAVGPNQPAFLNVAFSRVAVDPVAPSTVYACTFTGSVTSSASNSCISPAIVQRGVWKSTDGGQTWNNLDPSGTGGQTRATDLVIDPRNHNQIFAALNTIGIYRSTNGGSTWQALTTGLPTSGFTRIALAAGPPLSPSVNSTFYAAFAATNDNLLGIFRSTDGGTSWSQVINPQDRGQASYNLALAVDPTDATIIYYGTSANSNNNGGTVFRSKDGGQTWADLSQGSGTGGLHADTHALAISPNNRDTIFTGDDGGIFRSNNGTATPVTWTMLNQKLSITQFQSIALHPTDPNILLGGTQDNGTERYGGNAAWFHADNGDGGFALIDQSNPQVMYNTHFNKTTSGTVIIGPNLSTDGGNSWSFVGCSFCTAQIGGFNPSDRVSFYPPMALHTGFTGTSGNVIYFGTQRVYRTSNRGTTWTGLGANADGFGKDLTTGTGYVSAIAAHPVLNGGTPPGEVVWVGTSDGLVQITTNAGLLTTATFTNLTKAPLPNRFVTDIALDPNNQQRALVVYSGFNTNTPGTPGHVFLTTNQGTNWADISGNLPDVPVTSGVIDPNQANTYYIGTDLGVFQSTDGGATWIRLGNGLPKIAVFMLRYHAATKSLIAATHGRGVFRLNAASSGCTGATTEIKVDDGVFEQMIGLPDGGTDYAVNRLKPTSYPATLNGVSIFWPNGAGLSAGTNLTLLVGTNSGGGTNINGVGFQTTPATVQTIGQFNVYTVPSVTINSGDFVIGFSLTHAAGVYPIALDQTPPSQRRSYFSSDGTTFSIIDDLVTTLAGNFEIRGELQGVCCPSVTAVTPTSGAVGSQVTITGSGFTSVNAVKFANSVGATFTIVSDTTITATVPGGAVTGPITISKTGCNDAQTASFTVTCPLLFLSPADLPAGTIKVPYNQTLTASGGTAPYSFTLTAGTLPNGLTLSSTGVLSGTPTQSGSFNFTIKVTDANGCFGAVTYLLVINCPTITLTPTCVTCLPPAPFGVPYNQSITASGGTAPYSFTLSVGVLPNGLTLSPTGTLSGTPTQSGSFVIKVKATDANGCTGTQSYSLDINCPTITLAPTTLPAATVGAPYNQTISASPAGNYTFAVTGGALPAGLSLNATTGAITGTPTTASGALFTITATSASACTGSLAYTFIIQTQATPRIIRAVDASASPGSTVNVPVELVSQGNENGVSFSLTFDPTVLSNPQATLGSGAATATLISNANQVGQGQLGLIVALPSGQVFAAGTRQLVVVTFSVAAGANVASTPIGFGDQPIAREVSDAAANVLPANYSSGTVTITQGYEADVAPRPTGNNNGNVTLADYVQVGRFVAGLDTIASSNEFQRADCAPRSTLGDGRLSLSDYVQAGRYAAGLDPVVSAGGPTAPATLALALRTENRIFNLQADASRVIQVVGAIANPGSAVSVPVEVVSQGNENGVSFSLTFDPNLLSNPQVVLGSGAAGATLISNANQAAQGRLGIIVALPSGQAFASGTRQLIVVTFSVAAGANVASTPIGFGDQPIFREVSDVTANVLSANYSPGTVTINLPNPVPTLSSLNPASSTVGGSAFTLTVNGTNFVNGSAVQWNGANRTTTFVSSAQLTAAITAADIASAGTASVAVFNPTPGGGTSTALSFTISPPLIIRTVRVGSGDTSQSPLVTVPIQLDAQGDENALQFSLSFDPALLTFVQAASGKDLGGALFFTNNAQAAQGQLGLLLALDPSQTFAPGKRELVLLTFKAAAVQTPQTATVNFADVPVSRLVGGANGNTFSANYASGSITIAAGFEGDISPAPSGDNQLDIFDVQRVGRFAAKLETAASGSEFQRADCAPKDPNKGDGIINIFDVQQAARYAAKLDALVTVGGPTSPSATASALAHYLGAASVDTTSARRLRLVSAVFQRGQTNALRVELDALGDENALGFSVNYDQAVLRYAEATVDGGMSGAMLMVNANDLAHGRVGFLLALPPDHKFAPGTQAFLTIRFAALPGNGPATTQISFGDDPIERQLGDVHANAVKAAYSDLTLTINPESVVSVSAASYREAAVASEAVAAAFGQALTTTTQIADTRPLPTSLGGTQVVVTDSVGMARPAPLFFVSPGQINYQVPPGTATGAATVTVINGGGTTAVGSVQISEIAPGLFSANADGQGAAAAVAMRVKADGAVSYEPVAQLDQTQQQFVAAPISFENQSDEVYLLLFGTGLQHRASLETVKAIIGGVEAEVLYAGPQGAFVGLDQINVRLPHSLMGRGEVNLVLVVDGQPANTVRIKVQ